MDGHGGTLLPGLIDSHTHLTGAEDLESAVHWGVTTMLDMASRVPELVDSLRNRPGLPDILSCYYPASAPGSTQARMGFPASSIVNGPQDAERFVAQQLGFGADYIKLIIEDPAVRGSAALSSETVAALVEAAHRYNKKVFAHVTTPDAFSIGIDAGIDVLTHAPLGKPLPQDLVTTMVNKGVISVPTMVMMKQIAKKFGKINPVLLSLVMSKGIFRKLINMFKSESLNYHNVEETVRAFIQSGIPVIAGTDANTDPKSPLMLNQGESLHEELELMVKAGMSPVQALQSATSLPAKLFGLQDRGSIQTGTRADLILVDGNPTIDISATRAIKRVWAGGVQVRG
ncbi:amidohydrolase family protein [Paenibacillus sp. HW567]|uniref:amidohydrolase family protein n=1 Tax=Paenibacillus sp. HW567 TaxID=1034769 RepID=UPI000379C719|nr:amidohydrolase family protein [Paenibacillus sp. HW567]